MQVQVTVTNGIVLDVNQGTKIDYGLQKYVDSSWKTIEARQVTFDKTVDIDERVRLRNLITQ